jgi:hypothetical protein
MDCLGAECGDQLMERLSEFVDLVLIAVTGACTRCLIEELSDENSEIADVIARFQIARDECGTSPESAAEYADASAEFLTRVIKMALFTAELMHRPGVRWIDESTEIALPFRVSPN